jgi:2-polyprenyl-3-methyl-5-hydroxy-6-metoxy-1,4-benzoquinol methylase
MGSGDIAEVTDYRQFRYTADLDLANPNDPHVLAVGRVPARSDVLDLGAADGSMGFALRKMDCKVWGVELDEDSARQAREHCEEMVVGDLNTLDLSDAFGGRRFDVVLMLDVLEHLVDPVAVLRRAASVLKPTGWAVISLPNVTHISVRLALLGGRFTYTDTGLLDRTHLRFFDSDGVTELLDQAGWESFERVRVTRRLGTTEIDVDADPQVIEALERDPNALTYQFLLMAAPKGSRAITEPPFLPAAVAQRIMLEMNPHGERTITTPLVTDVWNQLQRIRDESVARRGHLKNLVTTLSENSDRIAITLAEIGEGASGK